MKLIIDIDENSYKLCKSLAPLTKEYISTVIGNGIPYEERPQSEWIINAEYYNNADIECSVCHNWIIGFNKGLETDFYRYCPFCGEHMRGGKE